MKQVSEQENVLDWLVETSPINAPGNFAYRRKATQQQPINPYSQQRQQFNQYQYKPQKLPLTLSQLQELLQMLPQLIQVFNGNQPRSEDIEELLVNHYEEILSIVEGDLREGVAESEEYSEAIDAATIQMFAPIIVDLLTKFLLPLVTQLAPQIFSMFGGRKNDKASEQYPQAEEAITISTVLMALIPILAPILIQLLLPLITKGVPKLMQMVSNRNNVAKKRSSSKEEGKMFFRFDEMGISLFAD